MEQTPVSQASPTPQAVPNIAPKMSHRPKTAPNVELVGEFKGSGFQERQWLVQRGDRFIQLTELLYRIAEHASGNRGMDEIAEHVTESTDWIVTADQVDHLIRTKLIPLGIVVPADGALIDRAVTDNARSMLQLRMRIRVLKPHFIDPFTRILQYLFAIPLLIPMLITIVIAHGWLYFEQGIMAAVRDVVYTPGALLVVLATIFLSGVVHEFGHAAALRYGGGQVRGMGVGLYLVYPAFYTDTTDSYRLGRWSRVRTALGGFYFHLIFAVGVMGLYWLTGREYLLVAVSIINLDILRQCLPFLRFDGYWALADLTGIPDFFSQMGAFIRSVVPIPAWKGQKLPRLKPWVKAVFAIYVFVGIPLLAFLIFGLIRFAPAIVRFSWGALGAQRDLFLAALRAGEILTALAAASQLLLLLLPLLVVTYLIVSFTRRMIRAAWRQPTWPRRLAGGVVILAVFGLVALAWLPATTSTDDGVPAGVESFEALERDHVEGPVTYAQMPPVGGNHAPIWQNCGFYDTPIADENGVHSMEHGAVWITYHPDLPSDAANVLREKSVNQTHVLVSPYPDLPAPVVASAWGKQLQLDAVNDPRLDQFIQTFQHGSQAPEQGGPCTGGEGEPA